MMFSDRSTDTHHREIGARMKAAEDTGSLGEGADRKKEGTCSVRCLICKEDVGLPNLKAHISTEHFGPYRTRFFCQHDGCVADFLTEEDALTHAMAADHIPLQIAKVKNEYVEGLVKKVLNDCLKERSEAEQARKREVRGSDASADLEKDERGKDGPRSQRKGNGAAGGSAQQSSVLSRLATADPENQGANGDGQKGDVEKETDAPNGSAEKRKKGRNESAEPSHQNKTIKKEFQDPASFPIPLPIAPRVREEEEAQVVPAVPRARKTISKTPRRETYESGLEKDEGSKEGPWVQRKGNGAAGGSAKQSSVLSRLARADPQKRSYKSIYNGAKNKPDETKRKRLTTSSSSSSDAGPDSGGEEGETIDGQEAVRGKGEGGQWINRLCTGEEESVRHFVVAQRNRQGGLEEEKNDIPHGSAEKHQKERNENAGPSRLSKSPSPAPSPPRMRHEEEEDEQESYGGRTGWGNVTCQVCNQAIRKRGKAPMGAVREHGVRHALTHSNVCLYRCTLCDFGNNQKGNHKAHWNVHHRGVKWTEGSVKSVVSEATKEEVLRCMKASFPNLSWNGQYYGINFFK